MKIIGIDDKEYEWKFHLYLKPNSNPSKLHVRARNLLHKMYPFQSLAEEVPLIGTFKERLVLDFYLNKERLAIEVQGSQHYKFNSFFYEDKRAFGRALLRDRTKVAWCIINNIKLVELPYDESDREWESRIRNRYDCE